ncbi:MAG TPA: hypothetical protein VHB45_14960 [Alloacidobacterium sp.]|nr:hypothetical protein [Alloacidobacterium sp.]
MSESSNSSLLEQPSSENGSRWLAWSSLAFALLQSACTFVVATSSIRVLIGLTSLAIVAGTDAPATGYHRDAIRIPMMLFALASTVLNMYALWRARTLRRRPSSQWRVQPLTAKRKRSERLQIALAVLTLILLVAETWTHTMIHYAHPF